MKKCLGFVAQVRRTSGQPSSLLLLKALLTQSRDLKHAACLLFPSSDTGIRHTLQIPEDLHSASTCPAMGASYLACNGSISKKKPIVCMSSSLARAQPLSTPEVEALLDKVKWGKDGLAVAIAQDIDTGVILMQGFVNRDALSATLASQRATFYSRSLNSLWTKGETSSNFITILDIYFDCDQDSIIYLGKPDGPTCHTGAPTCYYTSALDAIKQEKVFKLALPTLCALETTIANRKSEIGLPGSKPSWTQKLLQDQELLCSKIREEANELCKTVEDGEGKDRTASEMADVLYHSMVLLAAEGVKIEEVLHILRSRFARSGVEEKSSRIRTST